jgi:hypothetical protein
MTCREPERLLLSLLTARAPSTAFRPPHNRAELRSAVSILLRRYLKHRDAETQRIGEEFEWRKTFTAR